MPGDGGSPGDEEAAEGGSPLSPLAAGLLAGTFPFDVAGLERAIRDMTMPAVAAEHVTTALLYWAGVSLGAVGAALAWAGPRPREGRPGLGVRGRGVPSRPLEEIA